MVPSVISHYEFPEKLGEGGIPWGHPYVYKQPGDHSEIDLMSYGKDGQAGGSGEASDIGNW